MYIEFNKSYNDSSGEGICSVYIQPEGFGPPPIQQQGSYKKEVSRSFQQYTNGSSITTTEDFKVINLMALTLVSCFSLC